MEHHAESIIPTALSPLLLWLQFFISHPRSQWATLFTLSLCTLHHVTVMGHQNLQVNMLRKVVLVGRGWERVNERAMTSSELHVSQIPGVRGDLLPVPFLSLLLCLRWPRANSSWKSLPEAWPMLSQPGISVRFEIILTEKKRCKNRVPLHLYPRYPEVSNHFAT